MNLPRLGLGILVLLGCLHLKKAPEGNRVVTFIIKEHRPYCGGAPPHKEIEGGFRTILVNRPFFVKKEVVNQGQVPVLAKVTTDSEGRFSLKMDTGQYQLIFPEKQSSFEEFYQSQSKESRMLKAGPRDCFLSWWQKPEAVVQVTDTTTIVECILSSTCYSGFNPCMYYTGPKPP
ncbi:MAG: hypothetical protein KDC80_04790 [Saprospiraceae bacterium]|nr:hypothetical protein [Saprospiraceae bacterium]